MADTSYNKGVGLEDPGALAHATISWKAIFAGTFVALLTYLILISLGLAVGGSSLQGIIQSGTGAGGLGVGSAIWMAVSIIISLFAGGYSAGRSAGLIPIRFGRTQGLVIASLFFMFLLSQLGAAVGSIGSGVGASIGTLGGAATSIASDPQVQSVLDNALGDQAKLKSPASTVTRNIAGYLLRGDQAGARDYLARETGMTRAQADLQIQSIRDDFNRTVRNVGASTAKAVSVAGWTLFISLVLGAIAGVLGGAAGAVRNLGKPLSESDIRVFRRRRAA